MITDCTHNASRRCPRIVAKRKSTAAISVAPQRGSNVGCNPESLFLDEKCNLLWARDKMEVYYLTEAHATVSRIDRVSQLTRNNAFCCVPLGMFRHHCLWTGPVGW